jgi:YegS/Rv2252/BmrU family lipid kinase
MKAAVIVNPTKHDDMATFRAEVDKAMAEHGWAGALWLETTPADPGHGLARSAVAAGVDLVLASGGDGTVTACAEGLAGSGVPLGVLPAGTGNLLARNLGLPSGCGAALNVALTGTNRRLDVGSANGHPFVAMAGIGFDARILASTGERAKKRLGWVAYAVAALRELPARPVQAALHADGRPVVHRQASCIMVGNVGALQGGVALLPAARPDDGLLDLLVLTTPDWLALLAVTADVLLRRRQSSRVTRARFRQLRIELDRPQPWELDGEVMGSTRELRVTVKPGALLVRVPAAA